MHGSECWPGKVISVPVSKFANAFAVDICAFAIVSNDFFFGYVLRTAHPKIYRL